MAKHAAPALKVIPMRLDDWGSSFGTSHKTKWLLIAGAVTPPDRISVSNRRPKSVDKSGKYLHGITKDIDSIKDSVVALKFDLHNYISNMQTSRETAVDAIKDLLKECKKTKSRPVIYYTGHGETGTGDWVFKDGTISIEELEKMLLAYYPIIIADCCFSGAWADYHVQKNINGFQVLAATTHYDVALDIPGGGEFTQYLTNKIHKLKKIPVFGSIKHNDEDFPHDKHCDNFHELIDGHTKGKNAKKLVSLDIKNGICSAIFAKSNDSSKQIYSYSSTWEETRQCIEKHCNEGYMIKEIVREGSSGYHVIFEEAQSTSQCSLIGGTNEVVDWIKKQCFPGWQITNISTVGSHWFVVMTRVAGSGCKQGYRVSDTWKECNSSIGKFQHDGFRLKGYCYNKDLQHHFVFLNPGSTAFTSESFFKQQIKEARNWIREKMSKGYLPYLTSILPDGRTAVCLTSEKLGLSNIEFGMWRNGTDI